MKVLVLGKNGQLGQKLRQKVHNDINWIFTCKNELDITNFELLDFFFQNNPLDYVINCAAYNHVDLAEEKIDDCFRVNKYGVKYLIECCIKYNVRLIHFSTDYVFNGKKNIPYVETDRANPINTYGRSKLASEDLILDSFVYAIILRVSWLYSDIKKNFFTKIIEKASESSSLKVVEDQIGSPTNVNDLVELIIIILNSKSYIWKQGGELFHYSNLGHCSRYEFAKEICNLKKVECNLKPTLSKIVDENCERPKYSVLNSSKIIDQFNLKIDHWNESLAKMVDLSREF